MTFVGRKHELEILREQNWRDEAKLIVIYGRRRIGKSRLVEEAYKNKMVAAFDGLEGQKKQAQLSHFLNQLKPHLEACNIEVPKKLKTWHEALDTLVDFIKVNKKEEELIIFFDEFQWMAEMKSSLVSILKSYWDRHFIKYKNLKLIICGSISFFIVKKVIKSKALYGRIDKEIFLKPLSCLEIEELLGNTFPKSEILKITMTLGGVPEYLEQLDPKLSLVQNLSTLAFTPQGYFYREYQRIFLSHFGNSEIYENIISSLRLKSLTHKELERKSGSQSGGTFSGKINDLVLADFVEKYVPIDKEDSSKLIRYRLNDEYLHFYYSFIRKWTTQILRGGVVPEQILLGRDYDQWLGYAFERMCKKNAVLIADKLKFSGISYTCGTWFKKGVSASAQVDLLFIRADKVLVACELKHSTSIDAKKLTNHIEQQNALLREYFPNYALQNILILREKTKLPLQIEKMFAYIFSAEEMFLRSA